MELDRYGQVIRRRLGLVVAIVLFTAVVSGVYAVIAPGDYQASTQLLVDPLPPQDVTAGTHYYLPYYQEEAAQFILDDFIGVIAGTSFSEQVIAILKHSPEADVRAAAAHMNTVDDAQTLSKQFTVNRVNRLLEVKVRAKTRTEALAIEQAVDQIIVRDGPTFFQQLAASPGGAASPVAAPAPTTATVTVADAPHITQRPSVTHSALFWLLRTAVGLVAALAIVLVLHYFDDRLYDEYDVREMVNLPVLGVVETVPARSARPVSPEPPARQPVTARGAPSIGAKRD